DDTAAGDHEIVAGLLRRERRGHGSRQCQPGDDATCVRQGPPNRVNGGGRRYRIQERSNGGNGRKRRGGRGAVGPQGPRSVRAGGGRVGAGGRGVGGGGTVG